MKEKESKQENTLEIILLILFVFLIAIISGMYQAKNADFNPINGSFQNYNVVRRLLSGQIPFKDFAVYLGLGHLYCLSFFQILVGNNFFLSLFVSNMVTMLCFELFVFTIAYLIFKSKRMSLYISILLSTIVLINPPILANLFSAEFLNSIYYGINVGNSARVIRSACIFIFPLFCLIIIKLLNKSNSFFIQKNLNVLEKIIFSFFSGISILWSNDAGISTFLAFSLIYFILTIKEYRKNFKLWPYIIYIISSFSSFFICLLIATKGHIFAWLKYTLGVSSYQMWYFGEAPSKFNINIFDINLNLDIIFILMFCLYFIYKLIKEKDKNIYLNYIFLSIIFLATYISTFMYQWLSGGINRNIVDVLLFITCACYLIYLCIRNYKFKKNTIIFKSLFFFFIGCSILQIGIVSYKNFKEYNDSNAIYVKNLGGYLTNLGDDIENATKILNGNKVFSLYASALEANSNNYQPSGYDYIIHVLGDENRNEYMKSFNRGGFKFVATTDRDFIPYRYWIRNSNWFFYKELYKNYKPVFANSYNLFWIKDQINDLNLDASLQINKISENKSQIVVNVNDSGFNGIASVKLNYKSVFRKKVWKTFDVNKYVYVDDVTGKTINFEYINYNIPNESDEYYVPITIINGVGEIVLNSYPVDNTELAILSAEIEDLYDTNFKYGVFADIDTGEDNILYAEKTKENEIIFKNAKFLNIGNNKTKVIEISESENYIIVKIENDKNLFTYPNVFEIIK